MRREISLATEIKATSAHLKGDVVASDLWNLDVTLAKVISLYLRKFAEVMNGWPDTKYSTFEEYKDALLQICSTLEDYVENSFNEEWDDPKKREDLKTQLHLFADLFETLWW